MSFFFPRFLLWVHDPTTDTQILMMKEMSYDVGVFLVFLAALVFAYGIAAEALLYPFRALDGYTIVDILSRSECAAVLMYRPWFALFGQLMLHELETQAGPFNDDVAHGAGCKGSFFSGCGEQSGWLLAILLSFYVLFANILLVNLLIAMFNKTVRSILLLRHQ